MRLLPFLILSSATVWPAAALDVLFVGNSFTFGNSQYHHAAITDANGQRHGGVPALFKKLADEGGFTDVNVTLSAAAGQNLGHALRDKSDLINRPWDILILQDHSLRALTTHPGGNVPAFRRALEGLASLARTANPEVRIVLYQTWAYPKIVPEIYSSLSAMQAEITAAYAAAARDFSFSGVVPVGEAFLRALETGLAYDPTHDPVPGQFNLYVNDRLHHGKYGCYLAAALFYAHLLDADPRLLPTTPDSGAARLGLTPAEASTLQNLAHTFTSQP